MGGDMKRPEFELLVGEGLRQQGFLVIESGADGGADLVLQKGEQTFLVLCREWRTPKVDVGPVRELHGLMAARGAAGGFVVTTGEFSAAAAEYANACNIRLLSGKKLHEMLEKAKQTVTMPLRIEPRLGRGT
jgi:restriction system protein